jgi:5-oxoprolinase (ATP-hydrolysing) subunit C
MVVDHGRPAYRALGVPVGGAADRFALAIGNALVGNPPNTAALELTLAGPTLQASCGLACVVYGAPFHLESGRQRIQVGKTFTLQADEELRCNETLEGVRAYLCVQGGFDVPVILGSRSAFEPLASGVELPCRPGALGGRFVREEFQWNAEPRLIRTLDGPQSSWFHEGEFYAQEFSVSPSSNRMGLRLRGKPLTLPRRELVSEPVCPGAVQVTSDGQCIILGVDGQTIGGYPKIAQVISADLDKLGQLRPNDVIRFTRVTMEEAEAAYAEKQAELHEWLVRLEVAERFRS